MSNVLPNPVQLGEFEKCVSQADVAAALGTASNKLLFNLYSRNARGYRLFTIPKAGGGKRLIEVPPPLIMTWQRRLLHYLECRYKVKIAVHGFVKDKSISSNARRHVGRQLVLNLDLAGFFTSIHFGRVRGLFQSHPFKLPKEVAATLAQLCTRNGSLPQGAPTSPVISNLVCRRMDNELWSLGVRLGCRYTRYADDITISTNHMAFPPQIIKSYDPVTGTPEIGDELLKIFNRNKFLINAEKTRVQDSRQRQEVTGLLVNQRVNVDRRYVRRLRAMLNDLRVYGEASATKRFVALDANRITRRGMPPSIRNHVSGKLSFLEAIRGKGDPVHARYALEFRRFYNDEDALILQNRSSEIIEFLKDSLWVVLAYNEQRQVVWQGTAFSLKEIGVVSAAHVFTEPHEGTISWCLVRPSRPFDETPIKSFTYMPGLDLAIISSDAKPRAILRRLDHPYVNGDDVALAGFPNWHSTGDQPVRVAVKTVQSKPISGVTFIAVGGYAILSGASGGPVLSARGSVCGVITNHNLHATMPNSFIPSMYLDTAARGKTITV